MSFINHWRISTALPKTDRAFCAVLARYLALANPPIDNINGQQGR